jgi:hypothetical protein
MQAQPPAALLVRASVLLLILTANVAAPFRTAAGRPVLECLGHGVAPQSVARVRIMAHSGAPGGFRAVVGLAEGGPEPADLRSTERPLNLHVLASLPSQPAPLADPLSAELRPPLRC